MQRRLKSAGQRPISALVDITNYVMLDLGRPAHAYDLAKLQGALVARRARDGEKVLALNEKEYMLDPSMTVIADERQVHDIGGIMGGEHSGVTDGTTDVLLEIAYFTPEQYRARPARSSASPATRAAASSAASIRRSSTDGLAILTGLILEICGGEAVGCDPCRQTAG